MRLKTVLQGESQECGLACLAMIADAYGHRCRLADLRRRFPPSMRGMTLLQLIKHAQQIGLSCRPLRLELDELGKLGTPCILHWNLNHFVVLERVAGSRITVLDPAHGRRTLETAEVSRHFTGVALELSPGSAFRSADRPPRIRLRDLTGRIFGLKRALGTILALALALEFVGLLAPQVTQWIVDGALVSADYDLLLIAVLGGALLIVVDFIVRMARGWIALRLNQQLSIQWASNLFSHLMQLPWSFFEKRSLGDIASRFKSLDAIRSTLTNGAITGLLDGLVTLITLGMMFLYSKALTAIVLVALVFYGLLRIVLYAPLRNASEERKRSLSGVLPFSREALNNGS